MLNISLVSILIVSVGTMLAAPSNENGRPVENEKAENTIEKSVRVLENVVKEPINGIPQSLINASEGIMIFPGACKVAPGAFNRQGGIGIAMIRNEDGSWSNPFFVTIREGSLRFQIGTHTSDFVLLFKDSNDIVGIDNEEITLGGDVRVAVGPIVNRSTSNTDLTFETEIYTYHSNNGQFAGVSISGGILSYYEKPSDSLYGIDGINMDEIFYEIETPYNDKVNDLILALHMFGE